MAGHQTHLPGLPTPPNPGLPAYNNVRVDQVQLGIQTNHSVQQPVYWYNPQQTQILQPVNQSVIQMQPQPKPTNVPGQMYCPYCQRTIITDLKYKAGYNTWMSCIGLTMVLCCLFSWIPFCIKSCQDKVHSCPNCENVLHIYKGM